MLESREAAVTAGSLVREALAGRPGTRGIYKASAGARAVADAIAAAGRTGEVVVIAHEATDDRRALLRAGGIDAVIDQNPDHEVRVAVETLARLLGRLDGAPPTP